MCGSPFRIEERNVCLSTTKAEHEGGTLQEARMTDPSSPSLNILYPEWQPEYQAALLEFAPKLLKERVKAAETAIFNRLQVISGSNDSHAERQAIEDALAGLRVLKRARLGLPYSKTL